MDSGMKSLLELLPGIDDFLIDTLSKEKLSASTEKKRLYYVERLDVLRLPPTLPPRPDGLTKNGHSSSQPNINASPDDFIAQQRELAQQQHGDENGEEYDSVESPTPLAGVLETFGLNEKKNGSLEEDLYEVPVGQGPSAFSDGEYSSGTDYESYSDDEDGPVYQNEQFHETKSKSRGKSKRKKDKRNGDKVPEYETMCAKDYPNAAFSAELYQKWKLGKWMKRYCILDRSGGFLCFKNDRETKPVHMITNFEITYIGKEGKRNYVLRLAPSSGEMLYFSGENKEKTEKWMRALDPSFPGIDQMEVNQGGEDNARSTSNTNLSVSSSEGGSGDGVVNHGNQGSPLATQTSLTDAKNKKSMMDSISSFFSMGRKKGDKTKRDMNMADIEEREMDPDALVGGTINISSELFNHRRWLTRYCLIKPGHLVCFKETNEEIEFTLPIHGLEIDSSRDTKRQLAVRLSQEARERVILDFPDALEQGRWLSVLVKEIGLGEQGGALAYQAVNDALPSPNIDDDPDGDIYDEPYEDKTQNGLSRGRPGSDSLRSTSSNASNSSASGNATDGSKVPPPLPAAPPPANREVGHHGYVDDDAIYEGDDETFYGNDENHNAKVSVVGIRTFDGLPITDQIYQNTCFVSENDVPTMTLTSGGHGNDLETLEEECEYQNVGVFAREDLESSNKDAQVVMRVSPRPPEVNETSATKVQMEIGKTTRGNSENSNVTTEKPAADEDADKWDDWMKDSRPETKEEKEGKDSKPERKEGKELEAGSKSEKDLTGEKLEQGGVDIRNASAQEERTRRSHSSRSVPSATSSVTGVRRSLTSTTPRRTPSFNSQESSDTDSQSSDVIKCHQGPTINLDKEVLEQTENPILSQIRKNRTRLSFRQSDKENLLDTIGNTRKKLALLRKKRAELRAKKLHCPDLLGKKDLEEQLKGLQDEYTAAEKELEELKEQLDEMENLFAKKAKSLDRGTTTPTETIEQRRKSSTTCTSSQDGSPRTRRSFTYKSEESSHIKSSLTSSSTLGKTSCTVQFSAGLPSSTIAIRDYSKSTTTTSSATRSVQESRSVVRTTTSSGSRVVAKTTTNDSPELHRTQKMEIQGLKKGENEQRGGRQKVQEKLKLWESLSSTSTC